MEPKSPGHPPSCLTYTTRSDKESWTDWSVFLTAATKVGDTGLATSTNLGGSRRSEADGKGTCLLRDIGACEMPSDIYGQYTADQSNFSAPLPAYQWQQPQRPRPHRGATLQFGTGAAAGGGGGGGGAPATRPGPLDKTLGERWEERYRASTERAERIRGSLDGRSWGSPADYEDLLGPERSGGLDKIVAKTPTPSPTWRHQNGHGPSPLTARPKPSPGGLSGGAAKVPAAVATGHL